ncbi:hypothetical protein Isop_3659 [Isosphaera pallida ATCC 43644]|uniref:Uncharacterized protein n=1 Tax=Isosphaera pallida (strain ATCC 43644 / DSM 9630 / IS1B) TaxID=575540 RepID=E8QZ86_ISOPI|nr:hypothetical protein [Isosphaera pallida]ADV64215.1 hypothetical protein Isop_3659 [Isosphaera pallida ATCC 43644]
MMTMCAVLLSAAAVGDVYTSGRPHVGGMRAYTNHVVSTHGHLHGLQYGNGSLTFPFNYNSGAAVVGGGGPGGIGVGEGRRFTVTSTQVSFPEPRGMTIAWQTGGTGNEAVYGPAQLFAPARYNFNQGFIYRLKIANIPGRPTLTLYPTIEVAPTTPMTEAFLAHNAVPCLFTDEDFDQVEAGNFVTKVIYLPDPKYQELAIAGVETLVSTRLEPGVDPILEADRRGTILMIVRLGGINLEMNPGVIYGGASNVVASPAVGAAVVDNPVEGTAPTLIDSGSVIGGSPAPTIDPTPAATGPASASPPTGLFPPPSGSGQ